MTTPTAVGKTSLVQVLLIVSAFAFVSNVPAYAQGVEGNGRPASNSIYVELGGGGICCSINAERLLTDQVALRVGGMYGRLLSSNLLVVPVTASALFGPRGYSHRFELGAGLSMLRGDEDSAVVGTAIIGFRYQPSEGGLFVRLAATPFFSPEGTGRLFSLEDTGGFSLWAGVSIGYSF